MTIVAAIYFCCVWGFAIGILVSPGNVFQGWPAMACFWGMCATGLILAAHAL